jgi:predicted HTH domain antitoxin
MKTITLQIPDSLEINDKELVMLLASKLYEQGKLSLGQAASLVGMTKPAFAELLGKYNVSIINHPASEIVDDISHA